MLLAINWRSLFKSIDGGLTWSTTDSPVRLKSVIIDPNNSNILHGCGYKEVEGEWIIGYIKSTDGGVNWTHSYPSTTEPGLWVYSSCFAIDPTNTDIVYLASVWSIGYTYPDKLFKSTDGGTSWNDITPDQGIDFKDILIDPSDPNRVYTTTNSGIYRSGDGGNSWQVNVGWASGTRLAMDPDDANILYSGDDNLCFKSTDGGVNWIPYQGDLYGGLCEKICVDGENSNTLYLANGSGFFKSTDGGEHWSPSHSQVVATYIHFVKHDPSSPNTLWVGSRNNGLSKTTLATNKSSSLISSYDWEFIPQFLDEEINVIAFCPETPDGLYIAMRDG